MELRQILSKLKKKGKNNWLILCGLLGIALIGLSGIIGQPKTESATTPSVSRVDGEEYAAYLEERLEEMIGEIQFAGKCKVMVTMEQGTEYIYATEEKNTADVSETSEESRFSAGSKTQGEETYIIVSTDQGDQPLLLTQLAPRVKGVIVVCDGGENTAVCQTITRALSTALDISEQRICVVAGS